MAKFKFRLATLLRLREATRDERRSELGKAYQVDDVLREQDGQVAEELESLKNACRRESSPGVVDVDRLVEAQRYELALRFQQKQLGEQRKAVSEEIERRRQRLLGADRDVRVLEKLRDKQTLRHRREEDRQDIKQLDEVAQQRFIREDGQ